MRATCESLGAMKDCDEKCQSLIEYLRSLQVQQKRKASRELLKAIAIANKPCASFMLKDSEVKLIERIQQLTPNLRRRVIHDWLRVIALGCEMGEVTKTHPAETPTAWTIPNRGNISSV